MGRFAAYGAVSALVWMPLAAERSMEATRFEDRLGTVPVEVSLTHNGHSTLDTGVLGRLYWEQTGAGGFGARVRVTGTPTAGGTLASYVSPQFARANAAVLEDPEDVARAYGAELRDGFLRRLLLHELAAFLVGGALLTLVLRSSTPFPHGWSARRSVGVGAAGTLLAVAATGGISLWLFDRWEGNADIGETYALPGVPGLSFSSPQAREVAEQIQPFLQRNSDRNRARTTAYADAARASLAAELAARGSGLVPREGETIVLAEADPQGSHVGTRVRADLYEQLYDAVGADSFAMRTVSGDITSNGTVAESGFVAAEADVSAPVPMVAAKGDHDTEVTLEQLSSHDVANPDRDLTEVAGLRVVAGNDPAFKTLFGGMVVNESGISEGQLGEDLRTYVDEQDAGAAFVLLHQPRSAEGYLGVDSLDRIGTDLTIPYDDGIPDVPPGVVNIGHLHDAAPPRVIWNTDTDEVTWTVVNQLGTSGGVEEKPTYNRFSTPYSVPLKTLSVQLQYVDLDSGLQVGYVSVDIATDGTVTIGDRVDIGPPADQ